MTDREKVKILSFALETLAGASMGEPTLHARAYEEQVQQIARQALVETSDVSPQD